MAEDVAEQQPPKKKAPIMLIIIAAVVVLGGGAAAFFLLAGGGGAAPAAQGATAAGQGGDDHGGAQGNPASAASHGPLIEFMPVVVNLNEPEGARYLKIQLYVQLANSRRSDDVEKAKPIMRDAFIRELSDLNFRQTMGNKAKLSIKRRLLKRFNETMGADVAVDIHITQFIVQ